jgi:hypothetical protein
LAGVTSGCALETLLFIYGYQVTDISTEVTTHGSMCCRGGLREREDFQLLAMLALHAYCRDIEKQKEKEKHSHTEISLRDQDLTGL